MQRRLYIDEAHTALDILRFAVFFQLHVFGEYLFRIFNSHLWYVNWLISFKVKDVVVVKYTEFVEMIVKLSSFTNSCEPLQCVS